jgi:hypothetical protein
MMVTNDIKMPQVVDVRKYSETADSCSLFSRSVFSSEDEAQLQIIKVISETGNEYSVGENIINSNEGIPVRKLWRVVPRQGALYSPDEERPIFPPQPFAIFRGNISSNFTEQYQTTVLENNSKASVFPELEDNEEIEEAFLRGVQPINHQHKVLYTQEVEIETSKLRRWRPNIVLDPILFEDDE